MVITQSDVKVFKGASAKLTFDIFDQEDPAVAIDSGVVTALLGTLITKDGPPINGRNNQDIDGVNGGTLGAGGAVAVKLQPADTANLGPHMFVVTYVYPDNEAVETTGKHGIVFDVVDSVW